MNRILTSSSALLGLIIGIALGQPASAQVCDTTPVTTQAPGANQSGSGSYNSGNSGTVQNVAAANKKGTAQTFLAPGDGNCVRVDSVTFNVKKVIQSSTGPTGNLIVSIYETSSGAPTTQVVGSVTATIANASVGSTYGAQTATFSTPVTLTGGTTYAVVMFDDADESGNRG